MYHQRFTYFYVINNLFCLFIVIGSQFHTLSHLDKELGLIREYRSQQEPFIRVLSGVLLPWTSVGS